MEMENVLKPFWNRKFDFNWKFGLVLILIVCIPRFFLVLRANETANYNYIGLIMVLYAMAPFIFLTKYGRIKIGIKKPENGSWLLYAVVLGLVFSVFLYFLGDILYGGSFDNWYKYIGKSYAIPAGINGHDKLILFGFMAFTGMIVSPIGEELFFRGIVHSSFSNSLGDKKASIIDNSAFALVHISHFGLIYNEQRWEFHLLPTVIWVLGMFFVGVLFYVCRKRSGSILGAILCHSAFNLGMTYFIFYQLNG